jgi:hypothetical protein
VPYDVLRYNVSRKPDLRAALWNADGSGKYSSYVMYPNMEAMGQLNSTEVNVIWDYQRRTGARSVKFGAWSSNVGWNPNYAACASDDVSFAFTAQAPFGISGIRPGATLSGSGLYRCPGQKPANTICGIYAADFNTTAGIAPGCTATSILEAPGGVVGTLVK